MPGNYDDIIKSVMFPTQPEGQIAPGNVVPVAAGPIPQAGGGMTPGQGVELAKNQLLNFIAAQRQKSADMGLWDDQLDRPTRKGLQVAALKYGTAMLDNEYAKGGLDSLGEYITKEQ